MVHVKLKTLCLRSSTAHGGPTMDHIYFLFISHNFFILIPYTIQ